MKISAISGSELRGMIGDVKATTMQEMQGEVARQQGVERARPFVTISREAGAGGTEMGVMLAERLTRMEAAKVGPDGFGELSGSDVRKWKSLDREAISAIAADDHLSKELIASLEVGGHSWIEQFFEGMGHTDRLSELAAFKRAVSAIRALGQNGRVILIGFGGVFVTSDMPGGVHVRLVAPVEFRIRNYAAVNGVSEKEARERVGVLDANRDAFIQTYWPKQRLVPERFHLTLNTGLLTDEQMVDCILPLMRGKGI